nr:agmatinase [Limisalsivibrio acetivorans]
MACDTPYNEAEWVIFGAPYDGTSSYRPGSRFAPDSIRAASYGLETYSPAQDKDLEDVRICDCGDVELSFGDKKRILAAIEEKAAGFVQDGKKVIGVGGEHLVTLPLFMASAGKLENPALIHLDAHADLRDDYMGEKLSHATVVRRIADVIGAENVFQYGIRSGTAEEFAYIRSNSTMKTPPEKLKSILKDRPVYFTLDLDVLDPAFFPGTGTPEPGGWSFSELVGFFQFISGLNVVGCDVVELSPHYDHSGVSSITASKVLRELILKVF